MIGTMLGWFDRAVAEVALFGAATILAGGIDDLLVDLLWWRVRRADPAHDALPPAPPLRLAVFVPAWDEHRVIGAMLAAALARYDHPDYRIYVGCYPNDPATGAAVAAIAARDARVRVWVDNELGRGGVRDFVGSGGINRAEIGGKPRSLGGGGGNFPVEGRFSQFHDV